jgi:2-haloacid dehalogenase
MPGQEHFTQQPLFIVLAAVSALLTIGYYWGNSMLIDPLMSVEEVGIYEPDPRVYRLATKRLKLKAKQIVFLSANAWDAVAAANAGLHVAWINRFNQRRERLPSQPDVEIKSLADLPGLLGF